MLLFSPVIPAAIQEVPATKISERQIKVREKDQGRKTKKTSTHLIVQSPGVCTHRCIWSEMLTKEIAAVSLVPSLESGKSLPFSLLELSISCNISSHGPILHIRCSLHLMVNRFGLDWSRLPL